jgi:hypothetical protein
MEPEVFCGSGARTCATHLLLEDIARLLSCSPQPCALAALARSSGAPGRGRAGRASCWTGAPITRPASRKSLQLRYPQGLNHYEGLIARYSQQPSPERTHVVRTHTCRGGSTCRFGPAGSMHAVVVIIQQAAVPHGCPIETNSGLCACCKMDRPRSHSYTGTATARRLAHHTRAHARP